MSYFDNFISKYPKEIQDLFNDLENVIDVTCDQKYIIEKKLYANIPSFYVNEKFIRLIPFKDHINLEASGIKLYLSELTDFSLTPKFMLKLNNKNKLSIDLLKRIINSTYE